MAERPHEYISDSLKERLKSISIRSVAELMGAKRVRKKYMCYNGHDTEPSLNISEKKGLYHCFGCDEGGDVIKLVMNARKLKYIDACKLLMLEFGISDDTGHEEVPAKKRFVKKTISQPLPELVNTSRFLIYEWLIRRLSLSEIAINYLVRQRGFPEDLIRDLDIRDMPDPKRSSVALLAHFSEGQLMDSGLFKKDEKGLRMIWWDHVIIFPYLDLNLRIVNLQGRRLKKEGAKYVFLSGISPTLYNLNVLNDIERGERLLLCEGVPDTISAQALAYHAVGSPGAHSFKDEFVDVLMDYDICLVPHNDDAGRKFVNKVKTAFKLRGKAIREFKLPVGNNDLNDYLTRKNR